MNHLQTLKTEPLRFEAAAAEQVVQADPGDLPSVAIRSVEVTAAHGGRQEIVVAGSTRPNTLVEVVIESKSQSFKALPDTEGAFVVQADVQLGAGVHQVFGRAITQDGIEAGPISNLVDFTIPTNPENTNRQTLTSGALVVLGVVVSLAALVL
ncbi:hypothetical protein HYZ64_00815 [Candidatus Berkelbacteria bacterium]|nr:hypothetical protein [Candidatus Berkelbacteria bacterium]